MKQKNLFLLVGAPASGKSTFVQKAKNMMACSEVVSRDKVRFSLVREDEPYFSKENEVFALFIQTIKDAMAINNNVFIDATHMNEKSRMKTISKLNTEDWNVIPVVFTTPLDTCLNRNSFRHGRECVPEDAIINMYKSFSWPYNDKFHYAAVIEVDEYGAITSFYSGRR